jgi:hypothetical protein
VACGGNGETFPSRGRWWPWPSRCDDWAGVKGVIGGGEGSSGDGGVSVPYVWLERYPSILYANGMDYEATGYAEGANGYPVRTGRSLAGDRRIRDEKHTARCWGKNRCRKQSGRPPTIRTGSSRSA